MPRKPRASSEAGNGVGRRRFFGAVAAGAAGGIVAATPGVARAAPEPRKPSASLPNAATEAAETALPSPVTQTVVKSGSDFMVDVIKTLPIDYVAAMPGSTFRGLHESLINYGGNRKPELLTCLHEEISVAMAHGYAKVSGKPMMTMVHGVVGIQHASMAIFNAWADRVPVIVVIGNTLNIVERRPGVEWIHSAQDNAAIVRDFTKWDDMPVSLEGFAESMVRAWQIAMTPPYAPTVIVADGELAERPISPAPRPIPALTRMVPPAGDPAAVARAAQMLVAAERPVLVADKLVRSANGMKMLVELAELLGAPVLDHGGRMNMPSQHPLNLSWIGHKLVHQADLVVGLEVADMYGTVHTYLDLIHRVSKPMLQKGCKLVTIGSSELLIRPNFQDIQRYQPVDLAIAGDGEETLPILLEAVKHALPKSPRFADRAAKLRRTWATMHQQLRQEATYGWDASPISVPRMCQDLYSLIKDDDWALVTPHQFQRNWQLKLWDFDKHYQHIGNQGGFGVGYQGGAAMGAALAHRDAGGRLAVAILGDGELMVSPGSFWTAAHHKLPLLMLMHNNRAYHQELMHIQRMADRHARGITRAHIGTTMIEPNIDFAKMAQSMGVWAEGPISDPQMLKPALQRALAVVRKGYPALVDVVSQPR